MNNVWWKEENLTHEEAREYSDSFYNELIEAKDLAETMQMNDSVAFHIDSALSEAGFDMNIDHNDFLDHIRDISTKIEKDVNKREGWRKWNYNVDVDLQKEKQVAFSLIRAANAIFKDHAKHSRKQ